MGDIKRLNTCKRYSEATIYKGVIFLSGQVPRNLDGDIVAQAKDIFAQIDEWLTETGSDRNRILSSQIFLSDLADYDGFNQAWESWIPHGNAPARTTVQAKLAKPEWKLEVTVIAAIY
jgi:enamine deaminase RidA (YjgF/YER057c/UK114 family)